MSEQNVEITPQQVFQAHKTAVANIYKTLIDYICKIPLNPNLKQYAFINLDQGIHWIEKAINISLQEELNKVSEKENTNQEPMNAA